MTVLTPDAVAALDRGVLVWLATSDPDGQPNVSPKEVFAHVDGRVVLANIASPHSVANIRTNPRVCVSVVDVFDERGWKVHGTARLVAADDDEFAIVSGALAAMAGPDFPIRHVIDVTPTRAWSIVSPSHHLVPARTDAQRRTLAMERYGVRPRHT